MYNCLFLVWAEVMKGLCAKKQAKLQQQNMPQKQSADFEALVRVSDDDFKFTVF